MNLGHRQPKFKNWERNSGQSFTKTTLCSSLNIKPQIIYIKVFILPEKNPDLKFYNEITLWWWKVGRQAVIYFSDIRMPVDCFYTRLFDYLVYLHTYCKCVCCNSWIDCHVAYVCVRRVCHTFHTDADANIVRYPLA